MKKIYYCPNCNGIYGGNSTSSSCPNCHKKLKQTIFTSEQWHEMSKDEKENCKEQFKQGINLQENKVSTSNFEGIGLKIQSVAKIFFGLFIVIVFIAAYVVYNSFKYFLNSEAAVISIIACAFLLIFIGYIGYLITCGYGKIVDACEIYSDDN